VMDSPRTDPELRDWLRWASESGSTPMFVRRVIIRTGQRMGRSRREKELPWLTIPICG
jgi:hypothetical protein